MSRLEATLALSELLSPTYDNFEELKKIVEGESSQWDAIMKVANRYLLVSALYASLKKKGLLSLIKDEQLLAYMHEMYQLNTKRNEAILKQLNEICRLLATINIKPVLLKGSAALTETHYETIGERVMMDIDILVPKERVFEAIELLKKEDGYKEINNEEELGNEWHHYYRLYKESGMTSVEIHRYPINSNSREYFPLELSPEYLIQSKSIENAYVYNPTFELYHSFLHSEISHGYHEDGFLALRHLHHFTVMLAHHKGVNWTELNQLIDKNGLTKIWEEYLFVIQSIFGAHLPVIQVETKHNAQYLDKAYKRVEQSQSKELMLQLVINKFFTALSYKKLSSKYCFTNKLLLVFYIPKRIGELLYAYTKNSKKFSSLIKEVKMRAN